MKSTLLSSWLALGTLVAGSPVLELNGFEKRATNSASFNTLLIFGDSLSDNVCFPSRIKPSLWQIVQSPNFTFHHLGKQNIPVHESHMACGSFIF